MLYWFQNLLNHYSCHHYLTSDHYFGNFGKYAISDCLFICLSVCLSVCLPVNNITEKRMNKISWKFQDRWDLVQWTFCNILGMFHLTPCIQDYSYNPCLLWQTGERIFRAGGTWDEEQFETFWRFWSRVDFSIFSVDPCSFIAMLW